MAGKQGRKSNGEGHVRQRKNGLWEAMITLESGKLKSFYGKTKAEAVKKQRDALHALDRGLPLMLNERQTLGQFLPYWLDVKRPHLKVSTWMRYRVFAMNHIIPALGRVQLVKLTPQHLQHLYATKLEDGWSTTTAHHLHTVIHGALEQAWRWGLVPRNVADLVDAPRMAKTQMHVWTPEQASSFLSTVAASGDRQEALYVLALTTGMRQGELLALQWSDVLLDGNQPSVTVRRSLEMQEHGKRQMGKPKTEAGRRRIDLSTPAVNALRTHKKRQNEERLAMGVAWDDQGLVFCNTIGRHLEPNNIKRGSFGPLKKAAGVPDIRFHDLRHTAASVLLLEGIPAKVVSEMLGHASIGITLNTYSHVLPTMQRSAAAAMDRLFG
jgi:integrase